MLSFTRSSILSGISLRLLNSVDFPIIRMKASIVVMKAAKALGY